MTVSERVPAPLSRAEEREIQVVLVDDNEQWAEFIARDIERDTNRIRVTTALSANEAIQTLTATDGIECIVSDYRMPEVDGLQLLERVREDYPDLPFILVTGKGSEDIAERAISAGVSDYIVKSPAADQTSLFATRIERAVSEYRLRRAIEESEKRYRTVTENITEGIAIVRDDTLLFHNDRLEALTGYRGGRLEGTDFFEAFHPGDREAVRRHCGDLQDGRTTGDYREARLVRPDDETRFCVYAGQSIRYEDEPATLLSIRDITERRERQRRLEWERNVNRMVHEVLVESRTREELEAGVCDLLTRFGYALAWVGLPDGDRLQRRVAAGRTAFLDESDLSLGGEGDGKPSVWAARSREAQFVNDFQSLFSTEWCERALEHGLRAGGAVPLAHNGVFYGVLAVYRDDRDRFDDVERELLANLADTVAFAIHNVETSSALAAGTLVEVKAQLTGSTYYLNEVTERPPLRDADATVTVRGTLPRGDDATIQYVTVEGVSLEAFESAVGAHSSVADVRRISDEQRRFQVTVEGETPESRLASMGARVGHTTVEAGRASLAFDLPATRDIASVVDHLGGHYNTVTVLSVVESDREKPAEPFALAGADLTDKQCDALRAAYHHGYFEQPRLNSASDVADSLGVTHSTFLQHLRVAQRKVFGEQFD